MTMAKTFRIFDDDLESRMIVEASAGTGKTYTIVCLFIRMLLQRDVTVNDILVVTFTRMATRELKDRIISRLRESLQVAVNREYNGHDPFLADLADYCRSKNDAPAVLREAIRNFDDAHIYTIHGFCQKVLREEALESGMLFDNEVRYTDDFLSEAAEDFWRNFIDRYSGSRAGEYYIQKSMTFGKSPGELLKTLKPVMMSTYAEIEPVPDTDPVRFLEEMILLRDKLADLWERERENVFQELVNSNIHGMAEKSVRKLCNKFDAFARDKAFSLDKPDNLEKFTSTWLDDDSNLTKKGDNIKPKHPLFDLCDEYKGYVDRLPAVQTVFLYDAIRQIRELREKKARNASVLTYDDLLIRLDEALSEPENGQKLALRLQRKYPFALVDEFQDTDPVQYAIFDRIYPVSATRSVLVMIGDPKQSIYGFRGADIYAYLNARDRVDPQHQFTLDHNFRSSEHLIKGVNALFMERDHPFLEEKIRYPEARKGNRPDEIDIRYTEGTSPPLKIFFKQGLETRKDNATEMALGLASEQAVEMIDRGRRGDIRIGDRNLSGGDIAILVNKHREAEKLKELLKKRGVDSVTHTRDNVFETREAYRLWYVLTAVLDPSDHRSVQTALFSGFFGAGIYELYQHLRDEAARERIVGRFQKLKERWYKHGIYSMFRTLLYEEEALKELGMIHDSERVITNLQQLAEICAFTEAKDHYDPPGLHRWYYNRMAGTSEDEEQILRLESDRELVRVSTIHNSKGLEFPVVFCPVLWDARDLFSGRNTIEEYHDPENDFRAVINIDQMDSERRAHAGKYHRLESVGEGVRKAYVALTRARYECRIFWLTANSSHYSGLGAALLGKDLVTRCLENRKSLSTSALVSDSTFRDGFVSLSDSYPDSISFEDIEEPGAASRHPCRDGADEPLRYTRLDLPARLVTGKRGYSFSSLSLQDTGLVHSPDYDQWLESYIDYADRDRNEPDGDSIFTFPKGAWAGTLVHKLFEHPDFDFRSSGISEDLTRSLLSDYGFDDRWVPVLKTMMSDVLNADFSEFDLNSVSPEDLVKEMEFNFPAGEINVRDLYGIIRQGSVGDDDLSTESQDRQNGTEGPPAAGFMTGFIDLIVRRKGVYFILDYKSNYLGDSPEDYSRENLALEIRASNYDLQYHLYTLALKLYLEKNLPGFDYDRDFGGACYLFVRGMRKGSDNGIYFHKPDRHRIDRLEEKVYRYE